MSEINRYADKSGYTGNIYLPAGITQKNNNNFPLVHAADIQISTNASERLSDKLLSLDQILDNVINMTEGINGTIKNYIYNCIDNELSQNYNLSLSAPIVDIMCPSYINDVVITIQTKGIYTIHLEKQVENEWTEIDRTERTNLTVNSDIPETKVVYSNLDQGTYRIYTLRNYNNFTYEGYTESFNMTSFSPEQYISIAELFSPSAVEQFTPQPNLIMVTIQQIHDGYRPEIENTTIVNNDITWVFNNDWEITYTPQRLIYTAIWHDAADIEEAQPEGRE